MNRTWQPLLDGELADRAWQAISAIAADIGSAEDAKRDRMHTPADWALAGGAAGKALFLAYLAAATDEAATEELACDHLEAAINGAAGQPQALGLWEGILGVSWTYDHLAGRLFEAEDDTAETDAERLLTQLLERPIPIENYDLTQGLAGYGIACLEGLPRRSAGRALDLVLDHLLHNAEPLDQGIGWFTPPQYLPDWQRELAPDGYYNVGVAHGIPAVAVLLARCVSAGIRTAEMQPLLEGTVEWILAQHGSRGFPSWIAKGKIRQEATRLAWCYGDPGVAGALHTAAAAAGSKTWEARAVEVARHAAGRETERGGFDDAGICHGTVGLAHILNRLHQASGCETLARAARAWFGETLDRRQPGRGIGGYRAWSLPRARQGPAELDWVDLPGLLTGSAGIGLCLLAAVTDQMPEWDRTLGLSAPDTEKRPDS